MEKISIIIPVYNVEAYIRKCLNSVKNQTYKNLEIICIDDGSTDKSGEICDEYAKKDSRFKIVHKVNGGYQSAVNYGLSIFTGEYVGFVDSDDWIEQDYYKTACNIIKSNEVEIACFGFYKDTDGNCIRMKNKLKIDSGKLNSKQVLQYTFQRDVYPAFSAYLWNKLYRSIFFKSIKDGGYQFRLSEDIELASDIILTTNCALMANGVVYCESAYYHYFQRETSLVHSKDIEKRKEILIAYSEVIELIEKNDKYNLINNLVKRFYTYHASLLTEMAIKNNDSENISLLKNEMKRYLVEYIETNKEYPERIERINYLLGGK
ncbi:glycosyltransferase [Clostridium sp. BL-8]|uniref:glycosyltransferase family 2 protein n=1 Tax=Clostridium sp. BL-8 TaxID=349938 RepID=UPI0009D013D9|nr:glycosyltransferase [Clostridium sp. BL-8]OOM79964.1 putative glycosyltransferase EpsJ [Clostridium sp. BL-8]